MNEETTEITPKTVIQFTKSSSKDGSEGFSIRVAEGVDVIEATRVIGVALRLRETALAALRGKSVEEQLEDTLKSMDAGHDKFMAEAGHDLR